MEKKNKTEKMTQGNLFSQPTQPAFHIHQHENPKSSEKYLKANKEHLANNCRILFEAFMRGERLTSASSPVGDFRRRVGELKENGVWLTWKNAPNNRFKIWFMSESDKGKNKRFLNK